MKKVFKGILTYFRNLFTKKTKEEEVNIDEDVIVEDKVSTRLKRSLEIMEYHDGISAKGGKIFSDRYVRDLKSSAKAYNDAKDIESNKLREKDLIKNNPKLKGLILDEEVKDKNKLIRTEMDLKYKKK